MRDYQSTQKWSRLACYLLFILFCPKYLTADLITEHLNGRLIRTIVYDSNRKLIWFGTANDGLFSFDGANFTQYDSQNSGLPENKIESLALDFVGNLWIGSKNKGVSRFNLEKNTWKIFNDANGLVNNYVRSVAVDNRNRIWFGTDSGVGLFDGMVWYRHTTTNYAQWDSVRAEWQIIKTFDPDSNHLSHNRVHSVAIDTTGVVWFGTEADISKLRGEYEWDTISVNRARVNSVFIDQLNHKWFGTIWGLYMTNDDSTFQLTPVDFPACLHTQIFAIAAEHDGSFWLATNEGAPRYDPLSKNLRCSTGFANFDRKQFRSIAADEDGNLWFSATSPGGVIKYTANWVSFSTTNDDSLKKLNGNRILSVAVDQTDQTWMGTERGYARYDRNGWKPRTLFPRDSSNTANRITAIEVADDTTIWVGTNGGGVLHLTPQEEFIDYFSRQNTNGGLASGFIRSIAIDKNFVWFGTLSKGVSRYRISTSAWDTTFTVESTNDGLLSNQIDALAVDLKGRLWCGTPKGLSRYDGTWVSFTPENTGGQLGDVEISSIRVDRTNGRVWVGTLGGGVSNYLNGIWKKITIEDGLADNIVQDLVVLDNRKEIWFATAGGVSCLNETNEWLTYRTEDGLADNNILSIASDANSEETWFGTRSLGVTRYRRPGIHPNTFIENPFEVTTIPEFDLRVTTSREIVFRFFGSDLNTSSNELRYSFKLDDATWSKFTFDTFARIVVPNNGPHAFHIKAIDNDNNEDLSPATVSFYKIDPDIGMTTTFIDSSNVFLPGHISIKLYWPPNQLPDTTEVTILPVPSDSLEAPAVFAYDIKPFSLDIHKKGVILSFAVPESLLDPDVQYSIHRDKLNPEILGGTITVKSDLTFEKENRAKQDTIVITTSIDRLGSYALRASDVASRRIAESAREIINAQPRIFSPMGGGHGPETTVSFRLDNPDYVKVKVYNLSGRLVNTLWDNSMSAGINAVTWNGKDRDGYFCPTGVYIIVIKSRGFKSPPKPVKVMVLNESG